MIHDKYSTLAFSQIMGKKNSIPSAEYISSIRFKSHASIYLTSGVIMAWWLIVWSKPWHIAAILFWKAEVHKGLALVWDVSWYGWRKPWSFSTRTDHSKFFKFGIFFITLWNSSKGNFSVHFSVFQIEPIRLKSVKILIWQMLSPTAFRIANRRLQPKVNGALEMESLIWV